jgi:DNA-binding transcriptional regulator YhcF (GntR family)
MANQPTDHSEQQFSDTKLYLPEYAILQLPIRECKEVSESAKIYFGELAVLNSKRGYIPYTDEQLAEMKGVGVRTIKRWHDELEKNGFIKRKCKNHLIQEGDKRTWKKQREIFIYQHPNSKKECDSAKNGTIIDSAKNGTISNERTKQDVRTSGDLRSEQQQASEEKEMTEALNEFRSKTDSAENEKREKLIRSLEKVNVPKKSIYSWISRYTVDYVHKCCKAIEESYLKSKKKVDCWERIIGKQLTHDFLGLKENCLD